MDPANGGDSYEAIRKNFFAVMHYYPGEEPNNAPQPPPDGGEDWNSIAMPQYSPTILAADAQAALHAADLSPEELAILNLLPDYRNPNTTDPSIESFNDATQPQQQDPGLRSEQSLADDAFTFPPTSTPTSYQAQNGADTQMPVSTGWYTPAPRASPSPVRTGEDSTTYTNPFDLGPGLFTPQADPIPTGSRLPQTTSLVSTDTNFSHGSQIYGSGFDSRNEAVSFGQYGVEPADDDENSIARAVIPDRSPEPAATAHLSRSERIKAAKALYPTPLKAPAETPPKRKPGPRPKRPKNPQSNFGPQPSGAPSIAPGSAPTQGFPASAPLQQPAQQQTQQQTQQPTQAQLYQQQMHQQQIYQQQIHQQQIHQQQIHQQQRYRQVQLASQQPAMQPTQAQLYQQQMHQQQMYQQQMHQQAQYITQQPFLQPIQQPSRSSSPSSSAENNNKKRKAGPSDQRLMKRARLITGMAASAERTVQEKLDLFKRNFDTQMPPAYAASGANAIQTITTVAQAEAFLNQKSTHIKLYKLRIADGQDTVHLLQGAELSNIRMTILACLREPPQPAPQEHIFHEAYDRAHDVQYKALEKKLATDQSHLEATSKIFMLIEKTKLVHEVGLAMADLDPSTFQDDDLNKTHLPEKAETRTCGYSIDHSLTFIDRLYRIAEVIRANKWIASDVMKGKCREDYVGLICNPNKYLEQKTTNWDTNYQRKLEREEKRREKEAQQAAQQATRQPLGKDPIIIDDDE